MNPPYYDAEYCAANGCQATYIPCPKGPVKGDTHHLVPRGRQMKCCYCGATAKQIEQQAKEARNEH